MIARRPANQQIRLSVAVVVLSLALVGPVRADVWTLGHGDIGVAYDPAVPGDFEMEVHVEAGGVVDGIAITNPAGQAYAPGDVAIRVPTTANLRRINDPTGYWTGLPNNGYDFTGSQYDALGVPVGANLWVLSPTGADADHYGTPFLGWATEEGFAGEPFGNIAFTPTSFSAPAGGTMAIYSGNVQQWVLQAGDTTFVGDSFSVPAGGHTHRTLFFTQPGLYQVGIQAAGLNGSIQVSGSAVYNFEVVPEPSTLALAALAAAAGIPLALRRRRH
ncbi:MAG: choice-of-anchor M domain-containing protein [Planctomycetota bacterium]